MAGKEEKKEESKLSSVEFTKPWGRYTRGDIAGFDVDKASKLIEAKVAVKPGTAKDAESEKEDPAA